MHIHRHLLKHYSPWLCRPSLRQLYFWCFIRLTTLYPHNYCRALRKTPYSTHHKNTMMISVFDFRKTADNFHSPREKTTVAICSEAFRQLILCQQVGIGMRHKRDACFKCKAYAHPIPRREKRLKPLSLISIPRAVPRRWVQIRIVLQSYQHSPLKSHLNELLEFISLSLYVRGQLQSPTRARRSFSPNLIALRMKLSAKLITTESGSPSRSQQEITTSANWY